MRIGASNAAACAGILKDVDPVELFRRVVENRPFEKSEGTSCMDVGNLLEDDVAELYRRKTGRRVWLCQNQLLVAHPRFPEIACHPDGMPLDESGQLPFGGRGPEYLAWARKSGQPGLEIKTAGVWTAHEWTDHADGVPPAYYCQCLMNMICTGMRAWDLAVLIGTDFKLYKLTYDEDRAQFVMKKLARYLAICKEVMAAPEHERTNLLLARLYVNGSEDAADVIKWLAPKPTRGLEAAEQGGETDTLLVDWATNKKVAAEAETKQKVLDNQVRAAIGSREGLAFSGGQALWKANKNGVRSLTFRKGGES